MNLRPFAVCLIAVIFCLQPVFGFWSILFSTISYGIKAISFIKSHGDLSGDEGKVLQKVSVKDTGNGCTQIIQKLSGKSSTSYVNYHVDHDPIYDIVYSAANNGHTYQKVIETLTDKLTATGKGNYVFEVGGVAARITGKRYTCPGSGAKWQGKYAEIDYHIVLSKNNKCGKNWDYLKSESNKIKKEVNDYNRENSLC